MLPITSSLPPSPDTTDPVTKLFLKKHRIKEMSADSPNDSSVKACRDLILTVALVGCMVSVGEEVTVGAGVIGGDAEVELLLAIGVGTMVVVGAGLVLALLLDVTGVGAGLVVGLVLTTGVGNSVSFKEGSIDGVIVTSSSIVAATKVPEVSKVVGCMVSVGERVMVGAGLLVALLLSAGVGCIVSVGEDVVVGVGLAIALAL